MPPLLGRLTRAALLRRAAAAAALFGAGRVALAARNTSRQDDQSALPSAPEAAPQAASQGATLQVRLLAVNDFHGALETTTFGSRPAGGAAVLGAWLDRLEQDGTAAGMRSIRVAAGDLIGASPPISGLLQDEPAIQAADLMGIQLTTVGNHEFDEGLAELRRLQFGGAHPATGEFGGATIRYLAANVIDDATGQTIFPPYAVIDVDGVRIGFIGAVLRSTPSIVIPSSIAGLRFLDEDSAINQYAAELRAQGVRTIIALLHEGGAGSVQGGAISGPITPVVQGEDPDVDVVLSGHTHRPYWGTVGSALVTQANCNGTHVAVVDLAIDRATGDVVQKRAQIVPAYADEGPGLTPHAALADLVARTAARVAPITTQVVGTAGQPFSSSKNAAGESSLGNLIADAHRQAMGAQVAFTNPGGIRADLPAGPLTYDVLYRAQPFGNDLVGVDLTGAQLKRVLELQFQNRTLILEPSGLRYTWERSAPAGSHVPGEAIFVEDQPLDPTAVYRVAVNSFLAEGGDSFSVFREGANRLTGPSDLDALIAYVGSLPRPITPHIDQRITVR